MLACPLFHTLSFLYKETEFLPHSLVLTVMKQPSPQLAEEPQASYLLLQALVPRVRAFWRYSCVSTEPPLLEVTLTWLSN